MHINQHAATIGTWVDQDALSCPGCYHHVRAERPTYVHGLAGAGLEFSHHDGSELCADRRGRVCEPVEAAR